MQFSYNNSGAFSTGTRGQLVPAYNNIQVTKQAPVMHSFTFSKTAGMKYWANGGINADATASVNTTPLTNPGGYATRIGNYFYSDNRFSYNGYVAEYMIFTRDLKDEERIAIEKYLSQKYKIAITE